MRKVMERYYPVCLDKRILYQFQVLVETKYDQGIPCLNGIPARPLPNGGHIPINPSGHLRDHSRGRVIESGDYPYYDIEGKPLVYILPTWTPWDGPWSHRITGDYLNTLWQAMIKSPETTYEGLVLKNGSELQLVTKNQKSNNSWLKIRYR
jgi:hypothetical protein